MDRKDHRYFAITRESSSSVGFDKVMENYGWKVIFLKSIVICPKPYPELKRIITRIIEINYQACVFLSGNAVDILMSNAASTGRLLSLVSKLRSIKTFCIGPKTKEKLLNYGIDSVMPEKYNTWGLIECVCSYESQIHRIAIPRSHLGDTEIAIHLSRLGILVDQYRLYMTTTNPVIDSEWRQFFHLLLDRNIDAIGFTSPSSVRALFHIVERELSNDELIYLRHLDSLISIGHKTTAELKKHASGQIIEALEHTLDGIVEASKLI